MEAVLIIEDDLTFSRILEGFLSRNNYKVTVCHTGKSGLQELSENPYAFVLLDYRLPDSTGLEVLKEIKRLSAATPVIIMTSFTDIRTAVKAVKAGALEYITKPINPDELLMLLRQDTQQETAFTTKLRNEFVEGNSLAARQLHDYLELISPTELSVIIEGESGTGKENVARTIHRLSKRAAGPFVAVDCGALSNELAASELFGHLRGAFTGATNTKQGQFEIAHGGTLFLDEVGNLSYAVQIKLLRALQERIIQPVGSTKDVKVDVRIITATNDDLLEKTKTGTFREDLYHRLNEFKLRLYPLRERKEDMDAFITFFKSKASEELHRPQKEFSPEVLAIFDKYDWPGNLRELRNVIRRSVLLANDDVIGTSTLPPEMTEVPEPTPKEEEKKAAENIYDLKALQENQERVLIEKILVQTHYNKSKAAKMLNIDRKTLYLKMEKYGINY